MIQQGGKRAIFCYKLKDIKRESVSLSTGAGGGGGGNGILNIPPPPPLVRKLGFFKYFFKIKNNNCESDLNRVIIRPGGGVSQRS